ncbi:MAG TPA: metallophosphoesterase family protein, partial [Thermoanaerobaculia bacterium]|nr:metallophosphoesterase family protein [Thermoanaerobaculia bacterium]
MGKEGERLGLKRIGIIADTHGLLRPEVLEVFSGVDHILHAGDIGGKDVIAFLGKIAPVTFVRGNNDDDDGFGIVREKVGGLRILITHILPRPQRLRVEVREALANVDLVVFGHSHLPHNEVIGGVRFFNPASAGPRRFDYPVSVGIVEGDAFHHVALN